MAETVSSILKNKGSEAWSVAPETTVYEAIAIMAEKSIGALLVLDGTRLAGIISERDYARKVILQGRSSKDTRVSDVMTQAIITASPEDTIDECMRMMTNHRIRHLPVLDGDQLVGVVSIGDLVRATIADQAATIEHLQTYIVGPGKF